MTLANPLRKVASKLINKLGGAVAIRTISTGVYNPTTGAISKTTSDTPARGVLEDVNVRQVNDLIRATDKRLLIAAADVTAAPTDADEVVIGGTTYQVILVTTIEQDNIAITYELILRA